MKRQLFSLALFRIRSLHFSQTSVHFFFSQPIVDKTILGILQKKIFFRFMCAVLKTTERRHSVILVHKNVYPSDITFNFWAWLFYSFIYLSEICALSLSLSHSYPCTWSVHSVSRLINLILDFAVCSRTYIRTFRAFFLAFVSSFKIFQPKRVHEKRESEERDLLNIEYRTKNRTARKTKQQK